MLLSSSYCVINKALYFYFYYLIPFQFTFTNCDWIESTFHKYECTSIIPGTKDPNKCCCGLPIPSHTDHAKFIDIQDAGGSGASGASGDANNDSAERSWNPLKHTRSAPTDAYGCIDFRGGSQTNKAQVIIIIIIIKKRHLNLPIDSTFLRLLNIFLNTHLYQGFLLIYTKIYFNLELRYIFTICNNIFLSFPNFLKIIGLNLCINST